MGICWKWHYRHSNWMNDIFTGLKYIMGLNGNNTQLTPKWPSTTFTILLVCVMNFKFPQSEWVLLLLIIESLLFTLLFSTFWLGGVRLIIFLSRELLCILAWKTCRLYVIFWIFSNLDIELYELQETKKILLFS